MCHLCETKPVYQFTNKRKVCAKCFTHWFEKKSLYTIRKFEMINQNEKISYKNSKNFKDAVLEKILKIVSEKARIELIKLPSKKGSHKTAVSTSSDDEAFEIINIIINKKSKKLETLKPKFKKIIKPLYLFLDCEIELYAKINKLKYKPQKKKETDLQKFINELEIKHPEIKHSIINGYLELYN